MNKTPQAGIFYESAKHMYFLEYRLKEINNQEIKSAISRALQSEKVSVVISFGKSAWSKLQPAWLPATLEDFYEVTATEGGHRAPSTQTDLFFWLQGEDVGEVFDQAMHIQQQMKSVAKLTLDERGFDYHNHMDLIGFEDGTANPKTDELKRDAALIPAGLPGEGGSLVMSEKWVHNMEKWNQVPVHCQEAVVGRTKIENEELEGDAMPVDSHVSRTDLKVDGVAMKVYRRSAPFGSVKQNGLLYLAFACELKRFTSQLESMYGHNEEGVIDQLLNYSTAVSGSYCFAPAMEDLQEMLQGISQ
ncbi:Dyp-type peroxidase [Thiomicrorhabdus sp. Kp2]|uniref:Dyp-type peroxidase n=1 Tax=Thiomicrorhabdus sp. Kp2 TaxID=1123518 RepID=UPI0003FC4564|nr:Dyp-type peroxidase [Thiomicrorhabdus sp. Kp2]